MMDNKYVTIRKSDLVQLKFAAACAMLTGLVQVYIWTVGSRRK